MGFQEELPVGTDDVIGSADAACIHRSGSLLGLAFLEHSATADDDVEQVGVTHEGLGLIFVLGLGELQLHGSDGISAHGADESGHATTEGLSLGNAFTEDNFLGDKTAGQLLGNALLFGKQHDV